MAEQPPPSQGAAVADRSALAWLPDFCTGQSLLPVLLLCGLVALIIVLVPGEGPGSAWERIGPISFFTIWVGLVCSACLCVLKEPLRRLGPGWGGTTALLVVGLVCWVCGALADWFSVPLQMPIGDSDAFRWRMVALGMLVAAAALRYGYMHEQWKQQVEAKARAELDALQARIRPHFLFNTLNAVAALIPAEPAKAEEAVLDLSDLLRAALQAGSGLVGLDTELELVERYLAIERLRLGERLQVDLQVPPAAQAQRLRLPPLTLQPLVENAILHGIQARPEGGLLELWAETVEDGVRLHLRNPLPAGGNAGRTTSGNGIALANVRSRLQAALGQRAGLECARDDRSWQCTLTLPFSR